MAGRLDKPPITPHSKIDRGYPEGADNGLDTLRSHNVKKFQKDTYSGLTEHLAVVLRVEERERYKNGQISRHALFQAKGQPVTDATTHVVRARIVGSNVHEYMPKPINASDHQIIDLYPAFEISTHWHGGQPAVNSLIRVQFYDKQISSKRNLNGQILSVETGNGGSSYSDRLAWSQAPSPAFNAPSPSPSEPVSPPQAGDVSEGETNSDPEGEIDRTEDQDDKLLEKTVKPRWPLMFAPQLKRGQSGSHRGIDAKTGGRNGVKVLAMLDGVVERVYFGRPNAQGRSGGCTVIIHHPKAINPEDDSKGVYSWYMHLSKRLVKKGQRVKRAQTIGLSGGGTYAQMIANPNLPLPSPRVNGQLPSETAVNKYTGKSTGPHLHFEVRNRHNCNECHLDALKFLQGVVVEK